MSSYSKLILDSTPSCVFLASHGLCIFWISWFPYSFMKSQAEEWWMTMCLLKRTLVNVPLSSEVHQCPLIFLKCLCHQHVPRGVICQDTTEPQPRACLCRSVSHLLPLRRQMCDHCFDIVPLTSWFKTQSWEQCSLSQLNVPSSCPCRYFMTLLKIVFP